MKQNYFFNNASKGLKKADFTKVCPVYQPLA